MKVESWKLKVESCPSTGSGTRVESLKVESLKVWKLKVESWKFVKFFWVVG